MRAALLVLAGARPSNGSDSAGDVGSGTAYAPSQWDYNEHQVTIPWVYDNECGGWTFNPTTLKSAQETDTSLRICFPTACRAPSSDVAPWKPEYQTLFNATSSPLNGPPITDYDYVNTCPFLAEVIAFSNNITGQNLQPTLEKVEGPKREGCTDPGEFDYDSQVGVP